MYFVKVHFCPKDQEDCNLYHFISCYLKLNLFKLIAMLINTLPLHIHAWLTQNLMKKSRQKTIMKGLSIDDYNVNRCRNCTRHEDSWV